MISRQNQNQKQMQMQSFLGAAKFFHAHIPNYATWAADLYKCTKTTFTWDDTTLRKDYVSVA